MVARVAVRFLLLSSLGLVALALPAAAQGVPDVSGGCVVSPSTTSGGTAPAALTLPRLDTDFGQFTFVAAVHRWLALNAVGPYARPIPSMARASRFAGAATRIRGARVAWR